MFVRKEEFERALKRATKHKEKFKRESCRNTIQKTGITLVFFCAQTAKREPKIFCHNTKKIEESGAWYRYFCVSLHIEKSINLSPYKHLLPHTYDTQLQARIYRIEDCHYADGISYLQPLFIDIGAGTRRGRHMAALL